ncbi:MAG: LysR substrate-binding domain-containing protein [Pseudomonadota bacterium]
MIALDPDVLRTFIAIAETGSYARAGDQVAKTQSTVSMQMKRLEEALGVPVFAKSGRRNVLTIDGQRLLEYARRMVKLNDEMVSQFRSPELSGAVRIGVPDDYAESYLPPILGRFAHSHPLVEVTVVCETSPHLVQSMRDGSLDLSIISCELETPGAELIRREQMVWVSSAEHCTHEQPVLPFAVSQVGCAWRTVALEALNDAGVDYRIAYISSNGAAVAAAVTTGLAVAAMPIGLVRSDMRVLGVEEGMPPMRSIGIGILEGPDRQNPAIEALTRTVRENLANLGTEETLAPVPPAMVAA